MQLTLKRSSKRFLTILAALPLIVLTLALLYMLGMEHLEGRPRTYLQALLGPAKPLPPRAMAQIAPGTTR